MKLIISLFVLILFVETIMGQQKVAVNFHNTSVDYTKIIDFTKKITIKIEDCDKIINKAINITSTYLIHDQVEQFMCPDFVLDFSKILSAKPDTSIHITLMTDK